jgi:hypothetical protein
MKNSRAFSTLFIGLALSVGSACSSDSAPLAPPVIEADTDSAVVTSGAPDASLLGGLVGGLTSTVGTLTGTVDGIVGGVTGGLISCDVKETQYGSAWVGPSGGIVRVGSHTLVVPRGALKSYTRISATAPKGNTVLVDFQPHGLKFAVPTALTLSYRECGLVGNLLGGLVLDVVYVDDKQSILEVLPSLNDLLGQRVTGRVDHFSGYALAERKGKTSDDATLSDGNF